MSYAQGTEVSVIRSIGELDKLLGKHGATGFAYGRDDATRQTRVQFRLADRMVRYDIEKPSVAEFRQTPTGRARDLATATRLCDEEERRRWRALLLLVKALLVAVQEGVITMSDAFLPFTMLPSGETFSEWATPQLDTAYATARMPTMLPGGQPQLAIEGA